MKCLTNVIFSVFLISITRADDNHNISDYQKVSSKFNLIDQPENNLFVKKVYKGDLNFNDSFLSNLNEHQDSPFKSFGTKLISEVKKIIDETDEVEETINTTDGGIDVTPPTTAIQDEIYNATTIINDELDNNEISNVKADNETVIHFDVDENEGKTNNSFLESLTKFIHEQISSDPVTFEINKANTSNFNLVNNTHVDIAFAVSDQDDTNATISNILNSLVHELSPVPIENNNSTQNLKDSQTDGSGLGKEKIIVGENLNLAQNKIVKQEKVVEIGYENKNKTRSKSQRNSKYRRRNINYRGRSRKRSKNQKRWESKKINTESRISESNSTENVPPHTKQGRRMVFNDYNHIPASKHSYNFNYAPNYGPGYVHENLNNHNKGYPHETLASFSPHQYQHSQNYFNHRNGFGYSHLVKNNEHGPVTFGNEHGPSELAHHNARNHNYASGHHGAKTVTITKEIPVPYTVKIEKAVPYPVYVKVPVDKPYPVEVPKPYKVIHEVLIPYDVNIKVPKPYEVIKHVPTPVKVPVEQPYPVHVPRPYQVIVERKVPVTVEKKIPYPVHVPVDRPYPVHVPIEKHIPYTVEKKVPVRVNVPVDKPYPIYIPKPYAVHVEKPVPHPVEKHVPYPVKVPVRYPVKVPVPYEVVKHIPVTEHQSHQHNHDHQRYDHHY